MVHVMTLHAQILLAGFEIMISVIQRIGFFLGDFNFYRSLSNRNRPGGNLADAFTFNEATGHLGLVELR